MSQKGIYLSSWAKITILAALIVFCFVFGFYAGTRSEQDNLIKNKVVEVSKPTETGKFAEWKEYKNDELGISFMYPSNYGDVKIEYRKYGKLQQFIGTFSNNEFLFGSPSICEVCDGENGIYQFEYAWRVPKITNYNINNIGYEYIESEATFHAVFILKNKPAFKNFEFYGALNENNKKIINSIKIY